MDLRGQKEPASTLLNRLEAKEIERILWEYGNERWARRIAQVIVDRRKIKPLETTQDLVQCVLAAIPAAKREKRIHPATRTFQAVRIAVNRELEGLEEALARIAECLAPEGVLVVLSYHSGEDRIVKHTFRELAEKHFELMTKKPLRPSQEEIQRNPASRSAKLRAIRKRQETSL
jgi:16S rRNA (cytosine1402-N4)-methyltransferase